MLTRTDPLLALPTAWRPAAEAALRQTFGAAPLQAAAPVAGGLSGAPVFKLRIDGRDYLLRLDEPTDGFADPRRWHGCLRIAAEAGVAPPVRHTDAAGVSIVDFVGREADRAYWRGDRTALLRELGGLVRRLHAAPAFPPLVDYLDGMEALIAAARARGALSPDEAAPVLSAWSAVAKAYRALEPQPVSSHNDLNPRNVVAGEGRLWFVDWAAAFLADRYLDLASLAGFFARDRESESRLLAAYFDAEPTPAQRARLHLARQVNHMFYGMVMLGPAGAPPRGLEVLHGALKKGEAVFDSAAGRSEYARARLAAMIANIGEPEFAAARRLAA